MDVFGVPTFMVGDRAVFVRLMSRPQGDAALARRTIDGVLDLFVDQPDLNEFKHTRCLAESAGVAGEPRRTELERAISLISRSPVRSALSPTIAATKSVAPASASRRWRPRPPPRRR